MNLNIKFNLVLIQIKGQTFDTAKGLYLPTKWHPEAHACIYGTVAAVPEKLLFFKKEIDEIKLEFGGTANAPLHRAEEIRELTRRSTLYDVPIEIQKGDFIYYSYNVYADATNDGRIFTRGDDMFVLIPYDMCYLSIREDKITPLNGLVMLEAMPDAQESKHIILLEKEDQVKAKIAHIGCEVKHYLQYPDESDDDFYEVGDEVFFKKHRNVPIEWSIHQSLDKKYYKLHRKELLGKLTPDFS